MAVTMRDVALRAGVSTKTVSNVINGCRYLRPETRERVEAAIAELGYRMNMSARQLRKGRTGVIGLAIPELSLAYWGEFADMVIAAAAERGLRVLIELTGARRDGALGALDDSHRRITDGVLLSSLGLGPDDAGLLDVDFPVVLLDQRVGDVPVDVVTVAHVDAAKVAALHLAQQGCRRIAVLGARHNEGTGSAVLRLQGFREGIIAAGLPYEPSLVVELEPWTQRTGAEGMEQLLDSGNPPDGVLAMNDAIALGALRVLHSRKIAVPQEVAVVGFDNVADAAFYEPPLSSIAPGQEQIAREAVRLLAERIAGDDAAPRCVVADFELHARESSLRTRQGD